MGHFLVLRELTFFLDGFADYDSSFQMFHGQIPLQTPLEFSDHKAKDQILVLLELNLMKNCYIGTNKKDS